ncbi:Deoxyguanosinetriphosphate triphosphohydrolase-like protein [Gossypium arboreum]|uniref:Deoxyguanosinetriphosphate triphosphohydrolase-like protein n=1 Tax=Gossypium arboreum TaxID=29729 RepID=A0A0B0NMC6_GOSAR|nr:Deoxyguanosinetriphosphate triphosphohydrolase-like protein [Gossypium arboreum]
MPRPGPRPYECVRRAWHSERHQPMRGSIIQQILRLAIETHSTATKKNKEWQDKIITVIVKAEEIMYSKANSEAEYTNPETLWDRVNDAINTIIRRDESTETGELLPPCVEAALNLGCYPVRASRSQRHSNPRTYLTPRAPETVPATPRILDNGSEDRYPQLSPVQSGSQLARIATNVNSNTSVSQANRHNYPFLPQNCPSGHDQLMRMETNTPSNSGQVYPLYYGIHYQNAESQTDVGPSNTQDGGKLSDVFRQKSKEIPFFPERTVNDHFESFSRKCFMENEGHNVGAATRKRKATFGGNSEDEQFCTQPGSSSNNRRHGPDQDGKRNLSVVRNGGSLWDWKWITADAGDREQGWEQGSHACLCGVIHLSS